MKKGILSIGFNRPELLRMSIKAVQANSGVEEYTWHCYVDGGGKVQNEFYDDDYPDIRFINRDGRCGVSANVLMALKDMFETGQYDFVLYVEDDIIVSQDFIRFCEYCETHLRDDEVFTIGGYGRRKPFTVRGDGYGEDEVVKLGWWHPWGIGINKADYALIEPHITKKFLLTPIEYISVMFREEMKTIDRRYYDDAMSNSMSCLWDGLCNTIRAYNEKYQLMPLWSRCQNIGYYGDNQEVQVWDGADLEDDEVQKRAMHHTEHFKNKYTWDGLQLLNGKDYFLDNAEW